MRLSRSRNFELCSPAFDAMRRYQVSLYICSRFETILLPTGSMYGIPIPTLSHICQKNQLNEKNHLQCHCLVHIYNLRRTAKRFQLYRLTMSHNVQFHMCSLRSPFDNLGHPRILSGSLQHECLLLRFC